MMIINNIIGKYLQMGEGNSLYFISTSHIKIAASSLTTHKIHFLSHSLNNKCISSFNNKIITLNFYSYLYKKECFFKTE